MTELGARWDGSGTSFSVFCTGERVELCLLDDDGAEQRRIAMSAEQDTWTVAVPGVRPGDRYGFRAYGPFDPSRGLRFDANRLLADPYARAFEPLDEREVHSLVIDAAFDWGDDRPPAVPWSETVLYETHVEGISRTHPAVAPALRGTYAGLASEPLLEHLTGLGVTAVELLPVQQFVTDDRLLDMGLRNYWGYMTLGFLAPHAGYRSAQAPGAQVSEFKAMVKALHAAGLEVILDIVYNHTCEGGPGGPPIAYRGLANEVYYRLDPADRSRYVDTTGTGNMLNVDRPEVLRLIMDSLRYWVQEMHVDGFRFDLAATLARDRGSFDHLASFFDLVYQDPVVRDVKLIAEPWDIGDYQVGRFPRGWAEWNDRYRDDVRDFWRRRGGAAAMGWRLTGSADLYGADRRGPDASVNFVTAHDGKTLHDLVTYSESTTRPTARTTATVPPTTARRTSASRARATTSRSSRRGRGSGATSSQTLLVSQGVPMLLGGDERARTQRGNNNAYCQANEISWYDWTQSAAADELMAFTRRAIALQRAHATLRRRSFLRGDGDVAWFDATGAPMGAERWGDPDHDFVAYLLAGDRADEVDDHDLLVVLNAGLTEAAFAVPGAAGRRFALLLDTGFADGRPAAGAGFDAGATISVAPRNVLVAAAPR